MTCHPITHILRPHLHHLTRHLIHHIARHKAAHIAVAVTITCVGTPVGLVALLPPTVAPPFVAPAPVRVPEPGTWVLVGTAVVAMAVVKRWSGAE